MISKKSIIIVDITLFSTVGFNIKGFLIQTVEFWPLEPVLKLLDLIFQISKILRNNLIKILE